jgi:molecular chaperone GrpE
LHNFPTSHANAQFPPLVLGHTLYYLNAMTSEHDSQIDPVLDAAAADTALAPETPEELMEAATARIAELEAERDEFREKWMRAEAETQNVRNRAKRDVDETRQYAVQKFARDVAEAAENIKRGLDAIPARTESEPDLVGKLRDGFEGVERSFIALLERNGVIRTDPTGAPFDPNLHQAMSEQETDAHPPGTVTQAWTQAWTLNGRILRPAMVVVAKAPAGSPPAAKLDTTA